MRLVSRRRLRVCLLVFVAIMAALAAGAVGSRDRATQVIPGTKARAAADAREAQAAQTVDPALFRELHYRPIGPHRGGRVTAVDGIPDQPATFYMGATGGGVFKTTDSGQN